MIFSTRSIVSLSSSSFVLAPRISMTGSPPSGTCSSLTHPLANSAPTKFLTSFLLKRPVNLRTSDSNSEYGSFLPFSASRTGAISSKWVFLAIVFFSLLSF